MSDKSYLVVLAIVFLALISIPFVIGFLSGNSAQQFGGFLINPIDGHSYLAKMQQGYRGEWKFKLPYTAEPGEGAFLFTFYILLGHVGRLTQIPLIFIFHLARLISAGWMFLMLNRILQAVSEGRKTFRIGLALTAFGSGLGWIGIIFGAFTSDLWVAEIFPFLSSYTNPHFSLGLGIMIWSLLPVNRDRIVVSIISGILLGVIQPFGVVIIGLVKVMEVFIRILRDNTPLSKLMETKWVRAITGFCLAGGAILVYQYWAILTDPVLAQWHEQNITIKPSILDLAISLSPSLILAAVGARKAWDEEYGRALLVWSAVCLTLVFVPWSLQRRFLTGLFFPLASISVFGLEAIAERTSFELRKLVILVLFLSIPTNLIVIISGLQAITLRDQAIFIDQDLISGLEWIDEKTEQDALVLVEVDDGLIVPSLTGRRVIYGHPFETIKAEAEIDWLDKFFNSSHDSIDYENDLNEKNVDYVLLNGHEDSDLDRWLREYWKLMFSANEVRVFARQ